MTLAEHVDCLASAHENLLIEAGRAGVVVSANSLINLRRLLAKLDAAGELNEQLADLRGHAECIVQCYGAPALEAPR